MDRNHGGGEQWQAFATGERLTRLGGSPDEVRVAVLDGQTPPSFVFGAHVVLLDCSSDTRAARLRGPRQQAGLANPQMDSWAAYLRGQADALNLDVIDTTTASVDETASRLADLARRLLSTYGE
jgi:hypothetical protein